MRKMTVLFLLMILMASCGKPAPRTPISSPDLPALTADTISAEALKKRILDNENYTLSYSEWPGYQGLHEGFSVHGAYHKLYINSTLKAALPVKDSVAPDGSIIIKETFNDDKEIQDVYIMAKIKGVDTEHKDWYWAKMKPDGTEFVAGKLDMCIQCHLGAQDNDYIFLKKLNGE